MERHGTWQTLAHFEFAFNQHSNSNSSTNGPISFCCIYRFNIVCEWCVFTINTNVNFHIQSRYQKRLFWWFWILKINFNLMILLLSMVKHRVIWKLYNFIGFFNFWLGTGLSFTENNLDKQVIAQQIVRAKKSENQSKTDRVSKHESKFIFHRNSHFL